MRSVQLGSETATLLTKPTLVFGYKHTHTHIESFGLCLVIVVIVVNEPQSESHSILAAPHLPRPSPVPVVDLHNIPDLGDHDQTPCASSSVSEIVTEPITVPQYMLVSVFGA